MKLIGIFGVGIHMLHVLSSQLFEHKLFIFSAVKMDQIKISVQALLVTREKFPAASLPSSLELCDRSILRGAGHPKEGGGCFNFLCHDPVSLEVNELSAFNLQ